MRDRLGDADTASMRDLELMATLCPDVVVLVSIHKSAPSYAHPCPYRRRTSLAYPARLQASRGNLQPCL